MFFEIFLGTSVNWTLTQRNFVPSIQSHLAGYPVKANIMYTPLELIFF